jgi:hypothetical protein
LVKVGNAITNDGAVAVVGGAAKFESQGINALATRRNRILYPAAVGQVGTSRIRSHKHAVRNPISLKRKIGSHATTLGCGICRRNARRTLISNRGLGCVSGILCGPPKGALAVGFDRLCGKNIRANRATVSDPALHLGLGVTYRRDAGASGKKLADRCQPGDGRHCRAYQKIFFRYHDLPRFVCGHNYFINFFNFKA